MNLLTYCKQLRPDDWTRMVNNHWTIKDCVAHMVGWEKECVKELKITWATQCDPWFMRTNNWDDFNRESVTFYQNFTPEQLLAEWEKWQREMEELKNKIGEDKLKQAGEKFAWVFDQWDPDDEGNRSHNDYHLKQIIKSLKN
ncbi:hypothetical protein EPO05_00430 [Patescibacteria group bacterium]|nr:MAG: hypothetical protein EPO05_00430 [Patescibacteria group bacterium]